MSAMLPELTLLRDVMLRDLAAKQIKVKDIARVLGIEPSAATMLMGRRLRAKPRKLNDREAHLKRRLVAYNKRVPLKITLTVDDL